MDFTLSQYQQLLKTLQNQGSVFQTFAEFIRPDSYRGPKARAIVLRHDVDKLPQNSLRFARIQAGIGIKGTYYFRAVAESWDKEIIKEIAALGHEVGYHYETMDSASAKLKRSGSPVSTGLKVKSDKFKVEENSEAYDKLLDLAYEDFCFNLEKLRKLVPVSTICMHGSPRSRFDNKAIWSKYNYKDLGLIGEPYYDVDFDQVFYLTDTGRRWDGWKSSVRDKVPQQEEWLKQGLVFHSTEDIIKAIEEKRLPDRVLFTFHPQRWTEGGLPWLKELVLQKAKNQIKRFLVK